MSVAGAGIRRNVTLSRLVRGVVARVACAGGRPITTNTALSDIDND
jgi:hypothetical protein